MTRRRPGGRYRRWGPPLAAVSLLAACSTSRPDVGGSRGGAANFAGFAVAAPLPAPRVTLTDTAGRPFPLPARLRGRVSLLYFGYTHCADACPATMALLARALHVLPPAAARRIQVIFISTDPERDTTPVIRRWLNRFDRTFLGLSGTPGQLAAAGRAVGLPPVTITRHRSGRGYDVEHGSDVYAYSPDARAHLAYAANDPIATFAHDLPLLAAGRVPAPPRIADLQQTGGTGRIGPVSALGALLPAPATGADAAAVTVTLASSDPGGDTLLAAATPRADRVVFLNPAGRRLPRLALPARRPVVLTAARTHLELRGLHLRLTAGDLVPISLTFAHAGTGTVLVPVIAAGGPGS